MKEIGDRFFLVSYMYGYRRGNIAFGHKKKFQV